MTSHPDPKGQVSGVGGSTINVTGAGRHFGSKESSKSAYRRRPLVVERVSAGAKGLLMVTDAY